jgi:hypothetical protein
MTGVFISHAAADKGLIDEFVETILVGGCHLREGTDIFYSSADDSGVPDGTDLMHYVREQAEHAGLVIAIITPTYQTRPVCIAELGAAWARTGALFPVLAPGMDRDSLEGVLTGMTVRYVDDGGALDRLHQRVTEVTGRAVPVGTWNKYRAKWLAVVHSLAEELETPEVVTLDRLRTVEGKCASLQEALSESEADNRTLKRQNAELAKAKTREEVEEILLPDGEIDRFKALLKDARRAFAALDRIVQKAIRYRHAQGEMSWPTDQGDQSLVSEAVENGYLEEFGEATFVPSEDFPDIVEAIEALDALDRMVRGATPDFDDWFKAEYRVPPSFNKLKVFEAVGL